MNLFQRLLERAAASAEEPSRYFDATNQVGQAFGQTGQCRACGQPLADHFDRANRFHSCVERPVRRAA